MHSLVVCCTALAAAERQQVHEHILRMGGTVALDLTDDTTHLIAVPAGALRLRAARASAGQHALPDKYQVKFISLKKYILGI